MKIQTAVSCGSHTLRGIVHLPEQSDYNQVVLWIPGLDGTKVGPHRMLVSLSEALVADGVASVRYDLSGQGDSDGDFQDVSFARHAEDIKTIIDSIVQDPRFNGCELLCGGFSLGGLAAAYAAALQPYHVSRVVMLSPLLNYPKLGSHFLNKLQPGERFLNFNGNQTKRELAEEATHINIEQILEAVQGEMLMVTGSKDGMVSRQVYLKYMETMLKTKCRHIEIGDADHSFKHYKWVEVLTNVVCNFVKGRSVLDMNRADEMLEYSFK